MKKTSTFLCLIFLITLIGCSKKMQNTDMESTSTILNVEETSQTQATIATDATDSTDSIEDNYVWERITPYARSQFASGQLGYERRDYDITPLCEEDNITSIEYYLENGTGTFMDQNRTSAYADNIICKPYLLEGNNQEGIYFSVYYIFQNKATNAQKVKTAAAVLGKMHIRLTITYQDGSVKVRTIGFKLASNSNYKNLDLYELTLK